MHSFFKYSFLFCSLFVCTLQAQTAKRKVLRADYGRWGELQQEQISPDGNWISFYMKYNNGADTTFVQSARNNKSYAFPSGISGAFSSFGKWFTVTDPQKGLGVLNLPNSTIQWIPDVFKYELVPQGNLVAVVKSGKQYSLKLIDLSNGSQTILQDIPDYAVSKTGMVAALNNCEVRIILPESHKQVAVATDSLGKFTNAIWNLSGDKLAFMQEIAKDNYQISYKIYCYSIKEKQLSILMSGTAGLEGNQIVTHGGVTPLFFSPEGDRIFFNYAAPEAKPDKMPEVEIWDTALPLDYPEQQFLGNPLAMPKMAVWNTVTGAVLKLGTNETPSIIMPADRKTALVFNNLQYEPQFKPHAPVDIWLLDTETLNKKLLIDKQEISVASFSVSIDGSKIAYFRAGDWWIYDSNKNSHVNVTGNIKSEFTDKDDFNVGTAETYGVEGWDTDGNYLIVYDKYDIWLLSNDPNKSKRITDGRENKIQYRISKTIVKNIRPYASVNFGKMPFDLSKGLLLQAHSDKKESGFAIWKPDKKLRWVVYGNCEYSSIYKAANTEDYIYTKQTGNSPPCIMLRNLRQSQPKLIYQSNSHYSQYESGKIELINYSTDSYKNLQGILYYPVGFNPEKKYPMIVYIYEKQSDGLHRYINPTLFSNDGFNIPNFTNDDYFVLLPDIKYEIGEPGNSALQCTTAITNEVIKRGFINAKGLGLIGHSFGGYEVSYIITQTSLFSAAVEGAGISDMISNYFSMHWDVEHSNMWRYETQQLRMGKTPFDDYNAYIRNSPIAQVASINTPLLSWSGKDDITVNWNQNMELYLAMRRLNKKNIFLVYPAEEHVIINQDNQADLSNRIKNWFDSILK